MIYTFSFGNEFIGICFPDLQYRRLSVLSKKENYINSTAYDRFCLIGSPVSVFCKQTKGHPLHHGTPLHYAIAPVDRLSTLPTISTWSNCVKHYKPMKLDTKRVRSGSRLDAVDGSDFDAD
ncbi:hypothetical protein [Desulfuromonas sp. AOP6]|uniref:hypothetical protein n=1 Tax=Desulfuromonas sp. AOP6 TaxID=1566351 RepID=UPI0012DCE57C|nr:hypothetical protein [Desulfuromonas sp. AOP6]